MKFYSIRFFLRIVIISSWNSGILSISPFATLNLFCNCFGYLTTPSSSTTQKCHKILKTLLVTRREILSEHVKGLRLNISWFRGGSSCLLDGNLVFAVLWFSAKFCGRILKLLRLRILEFYRFKALNFYDFKISCNRRKIRGKSGGCLSCGFRC